MFADSGPVVHVQGTKKRRVPKKVALPVLIHTQLEGAGDGRGQSQQLYSRSRCQRKHITRQSSGMVKVLGRQGAPFSSSRSTDSPQKNVEPPWMSSSPQVCQSLLENTGHIKHM